MNGQLNIRIKPSIGIVFQNTERRISKPPKLPSMTLIQQLKDVRNELKQVKKERDILKKEVLNSIRII
jgi:hypothetical protein